MFSVTLRNLSPSYDVGHTLSLFLPLPYKKKKKNLSSQFCYKVIRIYPCLCIEPSLLSACIIHIRVSEVMQQVVNPEFQSNSQFSKNNNFQKYLSIQHYLHALLYVDSSNFVSVCRPFAKTYSRSQEQQGRALNLKFITGHYLDSHQETWLDLLFLSELIFPGIYTPDLAHLI